MTKKLFYLIAISIVALALIAAKKPEKKEIVLITPFQDEFTVEPKQIAVARFGWWACSRGLAQDYVDHSVIRLELYKDDSLLQTVSTEQGEWKWAENVMPDPTISCVHVNEPQWPSWYFEKLNLKETGVYTLRFYVEQTVQIIDGIDDDNDGLPYVIPAGINIDKVVTINVLE